MVGCLDLPRRCAAEHATSGERNVGAKQPSPRPSHLPPSGPALTGTIPRRHREGNFARHLLRTTRGVTPQFTLPPRGEGHSNCNRPRRSRTETASARVEPLTSRGHAPHRAPVLIGRVWVGGRGTIRGVAPQFTLPPAGGSRLDRKCRPGSGQARLRRVGPKRVSAREATYPRSAGRLAQYPYCGVGPA